MEKQLKERKPSAYKSIALGAMDNKPTKKGSSLLRWRDEQWANLTPKTLNDNKFYPCGTKSKTQEIKGLPSVCRPTKKVSKETPTLANQYNKKQIKKAVEIKKKGQTIKWKDL